LRQWFFAQQPDRQRAARQQEAEREMLPLSCLPLGNGFGVIIGASLIVDRP
jgi:hypothetical protein